jgi:hypothetical protein
MRYSKELLKRRVLQLVPKQLFVLFNILLNSWTIEVVGSHALSKVIHLPLTRYRSLKWVYSRLF